MKISKLFHWLYALVMLLPIFAIGVTCGYAMFNKNAYKSYSNFNDNVSQYVNITSYDDLIVGREYKFISSNIQNSNLKTTTRGSVNVENVVILSTNIDTSSWDLTKIIDFRVWNYGSTTYFKFGTIDSSISEYSFQYNSIEFTFTYLSITNIDNYSFEQLVNSYVFKSDILHQNNTIDNVFYYSVDKVTQSNMFNWAYDSFLVAPFSYIVNLFSMPTNSPVVMLLSYWLSISIIWLVFDLVMYVPLLVHRWIDKGVLE